MVTGPIPRKPKATSPKAKTGAATISVPTPSRLTRYATAIRAAMVIPSQKALKFPAVNPARMFSDAPPSRDAVTTSFTCAELVEVKIFTTSGITAPASVPQLMIVASFHQSEPSPSPGMSSQETR